MSLSGGQPVPKIWQKWQPDLKPHLWGYIWPKVSLTQRPDKNVNLTQSLTFGGTSDQRSAWPKDQKKIQPYLKPHLWLGTSDQRSVWPEDLTTMSTWPEASPLGGRGISDHRSAWPEDWTKMSTWFKASPTGGYIWPKISLTQRSDKKWQPDLKPHLWGYIWPKVSLTQRPDNNVNLTKSLTYEGMSNHKSAWSKDWTKKSTWLKPHLSGVHLTKGQSDPKIGQKCQPDPKPHLWGYISPKVSLTCRSVKKYQPDLKPQLWGVSLNKCKKNIWKFEHTLPFRSCFTEAFLQRPNG